MRFSRKGWMAALFAVVLLGLATPAMADQYAFLGKSRDHVRFRLVLCARPDGGGVVATIYTADGRFVCGPVDTDRLPDRALGFVCESGGHSFRFVIHRSDGHLVWKIQRGDRCITGVLCPAD